MSLDCERAQFNAVNMEKQSANPFEVNLDKNPANYVPLIPISFIRKAASVYPNRIATITKTAA